MAECGFMVYTYLADCVYHFEKPSGVFLFSAGRNCYLKGDSSMIVTVTLNPALDYLAYVPRFLPGDLNRTEKETVLPGGKGINVSLVLANLGVSSRALGFEAGFTGKEICRLLKEAGCETDFIHAENGLSRINVKIKGEEETEINGQGPKISQENLQELYDRLEKLREGDYLVLAGSVPGSLPDNLYEEILRRTAPKGVCPIVDASGELLRKVLPYRPFLIKPNHHELGELFGRKLSDIQEIRECAGALQKEGARNVLVSMAGEGAFLLAETGESYRLAAPKGQVINSVGAGDSMVAGFLAGWLKTGRYQDAFSLGVAAGSATAFQEWLAGREEIESLLQTLL